MKSRIENVILGTISIALHAVALGFLVVLATCPVLAVTLVQRMLGL